MGKSKQSDEKEAPATAVEPASRGTGAAPDAAAKPAPDVETLKREVVEELARLRPLLREVADKYLARLEAELFQIGETVKARDVTDAPGRVRRGLARIREEIDALSVRPEKARRKDLKRIEDFLDSALETVEGW